jgi:hypothetical protein
MNSPVSNPLRTCCTCGQVFTDTSQFCFWNLEQEYVVCLDGAACDERLDFIKRGNHGKV